MKYLPLLIIVSTSLLLLLDSIGNSESVAKLLVIHSYQLVIPALLFLSLWRWKTGNFLKKGTRKVLTSISVGVIFFATLATLFDAISEPNTLYNLTRLNQVQLLLLGVFLFHVSLIAQTKSWWKSHWKKFLFLYPFFFFYLSFLIDLAPFNVFEHLVKEDQFIESLQFLVLAGGSVACGYSAYTLPKMKNRTYWQLFFIMCAFGLGLVAADEISWGQRLLNIDSSETVKTINRQEELTIHNLNAVEWLVIYGYVALAGFGVFGRKATQYLKKLHIYQKYMPNFFLFGYFFLPLVYFIAQLLFMGGIWHSWSEVAELYLYTGIVIWLSVMNHSQNH